MADTDAVKEALDNLCSEAHYNGNTLTLVKSWRDTVEAALASRRVEVDRLLITEHVADSMARHGVHYQPGMGAMIVDLMGAPPSHTTNKEK